MRATSLDLLRCPTPARSLTVSVNLGTGRVDAAVHGIVDVRGVGALRRDLLRLVTPGLAELHLDLSAAVFADYTGAAALIHVLHRCRQNDVAFHVVAPPGSNAYRTLSESGLLPALRPERGAMT